MITAEVYHQNTREMLMTFNLETTTRCVNSLGIGLLQDAFREMVFEEFVRRKTQVSDRAATRRVILPSRQNPTGQSGQTLF